MEQGTHQMAPRTRDVVEEENPVFPVLEIGQRVRLSSGGPAVELTSVLGTVVRPDDTEGHYVIRLDAPARHFRGDGTCELLSEIVEASDNVEILGPAP